MDIKYEEPQTEWVYGAAHDTLIVPVPEYKKKELKIQKTNSGEVMISGERQVGQNKVSRFRLKFPIPANCDANRIVGNIKEGMLHVKFPKLNGTVEPELQQEKPKPVPSTEKGDQEQATQKGSPKKEDKQTSDGNEKITDKTPEKGSPKKEDKQTIDRNEKITDKTPEKEPKGIGEVNRLDEQQTGLGVCKEVFDDLVLVIRNPRRVINLVLALLLVVVLGFYIKYAFMSMFGETDDIED